jgi:hypothetical protein
MFVSSGFCDECFMQIQKSIEAAKQVTALGGDTLFQRILPLTVILLGLGITTVWVIFLAYQILSLMKPLV